jgi:hypothetical protein
VYPDSLLNLAQIRVDAKDLVFKHLNGQSTVQMNVSSSEHLLPCSLNSRRCLRPSSRSFERSRSPARKGRMGETKEIMVAGQVDLVVGLRKNSLPMEIV